MFIQYHRVVDSVNYDKYVILFTTAHTARNAAEFAAGTSHNCLIALCISMISELVLQSRLLRELNAGLLNHKSEAVPQS